MVPARNDDFGNFVFDETLPWSSKSESSGGGSPPSSSSTAGSYTVRVHRCQRDYESGNPVSNRNGFLWRNPSHYTRLVCSYNWSPAFRRQTTVNSQGRVTTVTVTGNPGISSAHASGVWSHPLTSGGGHPSISNEVRDRAVTECLVRLQDGKVNMATYLAESVKSANMVADSLIDIGTILLALKRGHANTARVRFMAMLRSTNVASVSGIAANGYLQFKYGWKPLLTDLYNLHEDLKSKLDVPQVLSAKRTISTSFNDSRPASGWMNREMTGDMGVRCQIHASLSDEFLHNAKRYGAINPLALGWELVPFSFVVDWGIPIGNTLTALTAKAGLVFVGGYTGQRTRASAQGSLAMPTGFTGDSGSCKAQHFSYVRRRLFDFPTPSVYGKSPFSTGNVLSALALWRQLLR